MENEKIEKKVVRQDNKPIKKNVVKKNTVPRFKKSIQNRNVNEKKIKFMALGGLGEVGKNCYVLEYENGIYIIDFGVVFPEKEHIKIDYIIPNYNYLKDNEKKIKGLFITHGHEDHIGGIPFLLQKVKIPEIYAPKTAKLMIEKKLKEAKIKKNINEIDGDTLLNFGKVKVHVFKVTHSIPDSMGFFIETPAGNFVTTGDFKIDFSPPGQSRADFHKMTELSKKGVLCMVSDSTNSMNSGVGLSESIVGQNLNILMKEAKGRIFFTTFASNINRVQEVIKAAKENNRKIAITGRSLINALDIGMKTKYIKATKNDFIDLKVIDDYSPDKVCVIMTGSQGEEMAALSRLANGMNTKVTLNSTDTIVFASNPIPGNNYQIGRVVDRLHKTNCNIIINSDEFKTHASGHASIEEQKLLLSLFNPDNFAPIHGTHNMLVDHQATANLIGIEKDNTFILSNGDVLEFTNGKGKIKTNVFPSEAIYISGNKIDIDKKNKDMQNMVSNGMLAIVAFYNERNKKLVTYPQITTRGYIVINESVDLIKEIQKIFITEYNNSSKLTIDKKRNKIKKEVEYFLKGRNLDVPFLTIDLIAFKKEGKKNEINN